MIRKCIPTALLLLILLGGAAGAQEWFRSSPAGTPGSRLSSGPSPTGWSLSITRESQEEVRNLYSDGTLHSVTTFSFLDGRLMAREEKDTAGVPVSRVEYAYDAGGNPRAIFIGTDRVVARQTVSADGTGLRALDGEGENWLITDYDESRDPTRRLLVEAGTVERETTWNRDSEGRLREEVRRDGEEVVRSLYDNEGRLQQETVRRGGAVVRIRSYSWSDGKLVRVEERGEGRLVVRDIAWAGDEMESETRSIDGIPVSRTLWLSPGERIESLYRDGEEIIRTYWADEVKTREEFLKDGAVVRVREYPG